MRWCADRRGEKELNDCCERCTVNRMFPDIKSQEMSSISSSPNVVPWPPALAGYFPM